MSSITWALTVQGQSVQDPHPSSQSLFGSQTARVKLFTQSGAASNFSDLWAEQTRLMGFVRWILRWHARSSLLLISGRNQPLGDGPIRMKRWPTAKKFFAHAW